MFSVAATMLWVYTVQWKRDKNHWRIHKYGLGVAKGWDLRRGCAHPQWGMPQKFFKIDCDSDAILAYFHVIVAFSV